MREDYFDPKNPHELLKSEFDSFRGRLCTVIESAGLPHAQSKALKILIKSISYQSQAVVDELLQETNKQFVYSDRKLEEVDY